MTIIVKHAETPDELEQYYGLRWCILRAPWKQPRGSEKDDIEDSCVHIMARENDAVIGVGRLQFNPGSEAQIRYMAVSPEHERRGVGKRIIHALEQEAIEKGAGYIFLHARERAVGFYERLGYRVTGKSYLLFDEIQHYTMRKDITR